MDPRPGSLAGTPGVLYARESSGDKGRRLNLDDQLRALREEAQRLEVIVFRELAEPLRTTGKLPFWERTAGKEILALAKAGQIKLVMVVYIDRFGRTVLDGLTVAKQLEDLGVGIYSINERLNSRDPDQTLNLQIRLVVAEDEHRKIAARLAAGKALAHREHPEKPIGGHLKFGYRVCPDGTWEHDPAECLLVVGVWERAYAGWRDADIFRWFVAEAAVLGVTPGVKSQKRGLPKVTVEHHQGAGWHQTRIGKILTDPVYLGVRRYGGYAFRVPPIITQELWDVVQARRTARERHRAPRVGPERTMLSGLLTCGLCGSRMYYHKSGKQDAGGGASHPYYQCRGQRPGLHGALNCPAKLVPVAEVDDDVWAYLEGWLTHPEEMLARSSATQAEAGVAIDQAGEREAEIRARLTRLVLERDGLFAMVDASAELDVSDIQAGLVRIKRQERELGAELEKLAARRASAELARHQAQAVTGQAAEIRAKLRAGTLSPADKRAWAEAMIRKAVVHTEFTRPPRPRARGTKDYWIDFDLVWAPGDDTPKVPLQWCMGAKGIPGPAPVPPPCPPVTFLTLRTSSGDKHPAAD